MANASEAGGPTHSILDFGFWILDFVNPQSAFRSPHSVHGDAIVRESHPLTLFRRSCDAAPQCFILSKKEQPLLSAQTGCKSKSPLKRNFPFIVGV